MTVAAPGVDFAGFVRLGLGREDLLAMTVSFRWFLRIFYHISRKLSRGRSPRARQVSREVCHASSFVLLGELLSTMDVRDMYEEFLNQKAIFADESMETMIRQKIKSGMRDMQAIIDDYRMVGNDEPIVAEYEFLISGNAGKYTIAFGQDEIIYERLEYLLNKRKGV